MEKPIFLIIWIGHDVDSRSIVKEDLSHLMFSNILHDIKGSIKCRDANESDLMWIVVHPYSAHLFFMYIQNRLLSKSIFEKHI